MLILLGSGEHGNGIGRDFWHYSSTVFVGNGSTVVQFYSKVFLPSLKLYAASMQLSRMDT